MKITLLALTAALALSGCARTESDAAFGERVRGYLLEHPEVIQEVVERLNEKQQAQSAAKAKLAIQQNRQAIERDPRDFVANPAGSITVVEFFDYKCGYCKIVAPEVLKLIEENPDVRFVFKELPIFGGVSDSAAKAMLSPQAKPQTLKLYGALMAEKALDEAALDRHLRAVGVDPTAARKSGDTAMVQQHVRDVKALAAALGLEGTPAFIVGDTLIPSADIAAVKAAIAVASSAPATASPAAPMDSPKAG